MQYFDSYEEHTKRRGQRERSERSPSQLRSPRRTPREGPPERCVENLEPVDRELRGIAQGESSSPAHMPTHT